jgi:hypothetical protein
LGGTHNVTFGNTFTPTEGDTFDIITAGSVSGHFDTGTGLFGFGDRSLYLKVVHQSDKVPLVATKVSGNALLVHPDTTAGDDARHDRGRWSKQHTFRSAHDDAENRKRTSSRRRNRKFW